MPSDTRLAGRGTFAAPAGEGLRVEGGWAGAGAGAGGEGVEGVAAAWGTVTHVFVEREAQRKSVEVGEGLRRLVEEKGMVVEDDEEVGKSWARGEGAEGGEGGGGGGGGGSGKAKL